MLAVDLSNYTSALTPASLNAWKIAGVELGIVQAIDPPPGYPAGKTRDQIQALLDAGLVVDAYLWLWFDLPIGDIQRKLQLLDGLRIRQLWLDVEDTAAVKYSLADCERKVGDALAVMDTYGVTSGDPAGVYSGRWFWNDRRYMVNTTKFKDRELWDSNYDDAPDAQVGFRPYGGWLSPAIKQYHGTTSLGGVSGVDLNVLSVAEAEEVHPPEPEPENPCAGPINALGMIGGDYLSPVVSYGVELLPDEAQSLVAGIRLMCDEQGIAHV